MDSAIEARLAGLRRRFDELTAQLADPAVSGDPARFRALSKEYADLEPLVSRHSEYLRTRAQLEAARTMLKDPDGEIRDMAKEEIAALGERLAALEQDLKRLLLPRDPNDERNVYLEIRAGAGGDEAAIFAGDLFRMYHQYALAHGWDVEVVSQHPSEHGGFKEIIARLAGRGVYGRLKYESGVHRVQRVPATEAAGRIHTSTVTVAVLPEAEEIDAVEINPADLKIDTFRASGAGGQHVNKTDSAIRLTHLPTGIVVECQDERSQHKNRARALSILRARLLELERRRQREAEARLRREQVGTGERAERIRTYNFPQGRVTDHRIDLTLYKLDRVLEGELDELIDALAAAEETERLAALGA